MITHRVAFCVVILTALTTATFTAAAVSFFSAVTAGAATSELSGRPGSAIGITAAASRGSIHRIGSDIVSRIDGLLPDLRPRFLVSPESDVLNLPGHTAAAKLQTQLVALPAVAARIVPVTGRCPRAARAAGATHNHAQTPVPACLPATAARVLGLRSGQTVTLRDSSTHAQVTVRITGTYRRAVPVSPYWMLDPMGGSPVRRTPGFTTAGPLVTSPGAAAAARYAFSEVSVLAVADFRRLGGTGLTTLGNRLANQVSALNNADNFHDANVTTALPAQLTSLGTALVVARTKILAGILTLLVIGGATLALAARLLAQRREAETALIGARGASRTQVARRGLIDAAVVAVPTAIAGPLLGALLAPLLVRSLSVSLTGTAWLTGGLVAAGSVAIIGLPWLRRPQSPLRQRAKRGRQRSIAAAVYANADLAVVALAAGAVWQLVRSAGPVSTGLDGTLSADPVLVLAPALALAGGALLTLRALPLAARLGDRLAAKGRGLVVPVAAWQLSRRALREAGPTLVAVLAVAAAVMAVAQRDSWERSVQAQAGFSAGADERITMPSAAPLPVGQVAGITGARGVTASTPAVRSGLSLPDGSLATLLALNGQAAAAIIPAQADGQAPAQLRRLAIAPQVGVAVPGRPAAIAVTARLRRERLRQPVLFVQVTDAAGIGYQLPAGSVPADEPAAHADHPHRAAAPRRLPAPADRLRAAVQPARQQTAAGDAHHLPRRVAAQRGEHRRHAVRPVGTGAAASLHGHQGNGRPTPHPAARDGDICGRRDRDLQTGRAQLLPGIPGHAVVLGAGHRRRELPSQRGPAASSDHAQHAHRQRAARRLAPGGQHPGHGRRGHPGRGRPQFAYARRRQPWRARRPARAQRRPAGQRRAAAASHRMVAAHLRPAGRDRPAARHQHGVPRQARSVAGRRPADPGLPGGAARDRDRGRAARADRHAGQRRNGAFRRLSGHATSRCLTRSACRQGRSPGCWRWSRP